MRMATQWSDSIKWWWEYNSVSNWIWHWNIGLLADLASSRPNSIEKSWKLDSSILRTHKREFYLKIQFRANQSHRQRWLFPSYTSKIKIKWTNIRHENYGQKFHLKKRKNRPNSNWARCSLNYRPPICSSHALLFLKREFFAYSIGLLPRWGAVFSFT